MAAIKRFKVYFTGGLPPMITFGITRAQVARQIKNLYGPEMIDSIEPASKKSSVGMAFVPLPFNTTGKELKFKMGGVHEAVLNKDTLTVEEIAKKHDCTVAEVETQLKKGIAVEKEHTSDEAVAREIALDHLGERLDYYTRLKMAEKLDLKKADIGTVIKDFQKSDAPQFKGKSDEKKREMAIAAKMNAEAMETKTLVTSMKETLASAFTLYLKSQNFHWNVQGPDFVQYHKFLGEYYEFVYGHVDKIAEQIRTLNAAAPGSMVSFKRMTKIMEEESVPSAAGMFSALAADNQTMMNIMQEARDLAEAGSKTGLVNYLEGAIDEFAKYEWMFKSIGGNSITEGLEVKNVKITPKSPDANKDGKVDAKDDLNKDGAVDAKDLKIAELEKDLKIKQLETEMDEMDDPAPEEEEPQINIPERPRIKDRNDHFEVMDHKGTTLKKFKYSHEEGGKSSREAREEAKRYVSKWYHDEVTKAHSSGKKADIPMPEEFVRVTESSMVDGRTKAFKEAIKRLQFAKKQMNEEDPCWDGYKKVPGKADYEDNSCVKEEQDVCPECNCYPCECGVEEGVDPRHQKVLDRARTATPRKPKTEYDRKVVQHLKKKHSEETELEEDEVDETSLADMRAHFARQRAANVGKKEAPRLSASQHAHSDQARRTQQTRREDTDMNEGNAFIFAAAQAKQAGKKSFEFNGKTYKVKLKSHSISEDEEFDMDELEYMVESIDDSKMIMLARAGMVDRDQLSTFKTTLKAMEDGKALTAKQRSVIIDLFGKLADLATSDNQVFQKAKKFAKEEVEYTSANFYADYIKNTKR
jgi:starvation-inducible DNA-binding protein